MHLCRKNCTERQEVEEEVREHYCCNGALNVTALRYEGRRDVPICVSKFYILAVYI